MQCSPLTQSLLDTQLVPLRQLVGGTPLPEPPAPLPPVPELEPPELLVVVPVLLPFRFTHCPWAQAKPWLQSLLVVHWALLELPQAATRAASAAKRAEAIPSFCIGGDLAQNRAGLKQGEHREAARRPRPLG